MASIVCDSERKAAPKRNWNGSGDFRNPVRLDAGRADGHPLGAAIHACTDFLEIGIPSPACQVVRVADVVAVHRFLSANLTHSCHTGTVLSSVQFSAKR
jgi:hypothetical protein